MCSAYAKAYTTRWDRALPDGAYDATGDELVSAAMSSALSPAARALWLVLDCIVRLVTKVSGIDGIALTKLDVLDGFSELKVCEGYHLDGEASKLPCGTQRAGTRRTPSMRRSKVVAVVGGARSRAPAGAGGKVCAHHRKADQCTVTCSQPAPRHDTILMKVPFSD